MVFWKCQLIKFFLLWCDGGPEAFVSFYWPTIPLHAEFMIISFQDPFDSSLLAASDCNLGIPNPGIPGLQISQSRISELNVQSRDCNHYLRHGQRAVAASSPQYQNNLAYLVYSDSVIVVYSAHDETGDCIGPAAAVCKCLVLSSFALQCSILHTP